MEIIYTNILDDISAAISAAEEHGRTIKEIILTVREYGEMKKALGLFGDPSGDETVMGVPIKVARKLPG